MAKNYNIFLILKGKNPLLRVPVQSFISSNYENAKLYFQGYLIDEKEPQNYVLYKIGEVNKNLKIENECKIFICGGYEIANLNKKNKLAKQIKIDYKNIPNGKENTIELIEKLFDGIKIKC